MGHLWWFSPGFIFSWWAGIIYVSQTRRFPKCADLTLISQRGIIDREAFSLRQCHFYICSVQNRANFSFSLFFYCIMLKEKSRARIWQLTQLTPTVQLQYALRRIETWNKMVAGLILSPNDFFDLYFHKWISTRLRKGFYADNIPTC